MDRRDQELLDRQLSKFNSPRRHDGIVTLALVAVFFAGVTLGGLFIEHTPPVRQQALTSARIAHAGGPVARAGSGEPVRVF
jgi:hypothetical protein